MPRKRRASAFSMSFLDIMSCGFGAVVLVFMIINHQVRVRSDEVNGEKLARANYLELEVSAGQRNLEKILNSLKIVEEELVKTEGLSRQVIETLKLSEEELATFENETLALEDHINQLKADIESTEEATKRLKAQVTEDPSTAIPQTFIGPGDRQFVTGIRLGGERVGIYLDASASMLADTLVNVIRRRNMRDREKRASEKWQRAVRTVQWLLNEMPDDSTFQVVVFNNEARNILEDDDRDWLPAGDDEVLDKIDEALEEIVPGEGTSLYKALAHTRGFPGGRPDNIIIITDGLPTQGKNAPRRRTVNAGQREKFLSEAWGQLSGSRVTITTVLFPMEGDPTAPVAYWQAAARTGGTVLSPAQDWP